MRKEFIEIEGLKIQSIASAIKAVLAAVQAVRLCEEQTAVLHGMSAAQLAIIAHLGRESPSSIGDIADELHVHQSSVSSIVARLIKDGIVLKKPAADGRRVEVLLSARGRVVAKKSGATGRPLLEASLESWTPESRDRLVVSLSQLTGAMEEQLSAAELPV